MRYLILDAKYPRFLERIYASDPELIHADYEAQRAAISGGLFGEVDSQVRALRSLGHEADSIVANAAPAQRAWARESGVKYRVRDAWKLVGRRGLPVPTRIREEIAWPVVVEQVRRYRPDVLYVGILDRTPPAIVAELRHLCRLVVAQIAAAIPDWDYRGYGLILSSIPGFVLRFRNVGIDAEWVPLAFDPSIAETVREPQRDVDVSFVGSFTDDYDDRLATCEAVAGSVSLQTWTASTVDASSPVRETVRGEAFGSDMYRVLARSRITLNTHNRVAGPDANNLRLFEATGMGAMLLTDARRNLKDYFDIGTEVVTFGSPQEASQLARWYVDNPGEAARIGSAGQVRTLRDHTWDRRMEQTTAIVSDRLG